MDSQAKVSLQLLFLLLLLLLQLCSDHRVQAQVNPSQQSAYIALQAWKRSITNDPLGITATWVGPNVCSYRGVFCSPLSSLGSEDEFPVPQSSKSAQERPQQARTAEFLPESPSCEQVVSGIDLNHGYLSGVLPEELGLLTHLALFHINTNFFCGSIPSSMAALALLYELDVSNNRLSGAFPIVTLAMPSLRYLDIRFNDFDGELPPALFESPHLDAIFVNNNRFASQIPWNLGSSRASVANFANNLFEGGIPSSIGNMKHTLNELIMLNNRLDGCIPPQVGFLDQLTVLDVSFNRLGGALPGSMAAMLSVEQLDVASNLLTGQIPAGICDLPRLINFTFSDNFFTGESPDCISRPGIVVDDRANCIPDRPLQRPPQQCQALLSQEPSCFPLPPAKSLMPPEQQPCAPPPPPIY